MKEIYELSDAQRILGKAIHGAGGVVEFYRLHNISDSVTDLLQDDDVLAVLNLRKVEAFERIET